MDDTYIYLSVKLYLKSGQTEDSIQEIVQDMDYNFHHDDIVEYEIVDITDTQIPEAEVLTDLSALNDYQRETLAYYDGYGGRE